MSRECLFDIGFSAIVLHILCMLRHVSHRRTLFDILLIIVFDNKQLM